MAFFNVRQIVTGLRWFARTVGISILGFITVMTILGGLPNPFDASLQENLTAMALLVMAIGLPFGWKWEGIGGLLILSGFTLLTIVDRSLRPDAVILAWIATGFLYSACWWITARFLNGEDADQVKCVAGTFNVKRFWIPVILMLAHAALVTLIGIEIALSHDPEAGMIWILFIHIDYPMSLCIGLLPPIFSSNALIVPTILVVGTIQWGIVGLALQKVVKRFRC